MQNERHGESTMEAVRWSSIDCTHDKSFSVEKIKLNWFDLKFTCKKTVTLFYNKELSKTGGGPCKAVNSANSWLVSPSNKQLDLLHPKISHLIHKFILQNHHKASTNYLPTTGKTSLNACKKFFEKFYKWFYRAFVNLSEDWGKFTNILSHFHSIFPNQKKC